MAEYIEREALLTKMKKLFSKEELKVNTSNDIARAAILLVEYEPTADVAEVRHGKWETDKEDLEWGNALKKKHCSVCNARPFFDRDKWEFILTDYCPNCGAKMDLGDGEE